VTSPRVVCCGEALVDLLATDAAGRQWRAVPGGAPFNAAVAAGRLGAPTSFLGVLSEDRFGRLLGARLTESHVDHRQCPRTHEPTTLALVSADARGEPSYTFHVAGTTTTSTRVNDLHLPADIGVMHVSGSVALVVEPAASRLAALLAAAQHRALLHVDLNPRPAVIGREEFRRRLDRWLERVDVVKVSDADMGWIEPGADAIDVADGWLRGSDADGEPGGEHDDHRPLAVVVTRGERGAAVVRASGVVEVPAPPVDVVDTVGAGDAFTGAMLAAFAAHRVTGRPELARLDTGWWRTALTYATEAAGISCTRQGADPPWRHELH
jgi:fructokinase